MSKPVNLTTAELPESDLEVVTAGFVKSPGGVGGPLSGVGVRPGLGLGGFGGPASGLGVRPGLGVGAPGAGFRRGIG